LSHCGAAPLGAAPSSDRRISGASGDRLSQCGPRGCRGRDPMGSGESRPQLFLRGFP